MVTKTWSATLQGIDGELVGIESSRQPNLPKISITGLPGEAIRESREKVRACLVQLGFDVPSSHILIHLWPANTRKGGSHFDLAIAVAILGAEEKIPLDKIPRMAFLGELTITGDLLPVPGIVGLLEPLVQHPDIDFVILPQANGWEAALLPSPKVKLARHLGEVLNFIQGKANLADPIAPIPLRPKRPELMDSIRGNPHAKRAIEIAIAGRHHLLFVGPPGVGKTLLARATQSLLSPLASPEVAHVLKTHSTGRQEGRSPWERPFRSPHHSVSMAGLLGGGSQVLQPGEVTLAHLGVLFLDEFPEFRRDAIEGLREPLQNGSIRVQRVGVGQPLPARFTLMVAMNPCPCGYALSSQKMCSCTREVRAKYQRRVSGPVLERIDLYVSLGFTEESTNPDPPSRWKQNQMEKRIQAAVDVQRRRYGNALDRNGDSEIDAAGAFHLGPEETRWWEGHAVPQARNHRMLDKLLRLSRTIADLEGEEWISLCHLQEAWLFRCVPQKVAGWL